jgi:RNA polymerase sigma factor (sigma-70 family)
MAANGVTSVVRFLRRAAVAEMEHTDGELLGEFIERHNEEAFAALVRRHGRMVWGVCLRLLGHMQDAEDAFQATFLVLARKGNTVSPRDVVGNWLYGVAYQTAVRARALNLKRRGWERQMATMPERYAPSTASWDDLKPILDEELTRLPDKYRAVLVLCDVEGRTRKEAARHLACPEGSVSSRLARARTLLAGRLARRGVALSAGALAATLSEHALGAVPAAVLGATLQTAGQATANGVVSATVAALAQQVMRRMVFGKIKALGAVVLVVGMLGGVSGLLIRDAGAYDNLAPAPQAPKDKAPAPRTDEDKLQGLWQAVVLEVNGQMAPEETIKEFKIRIHGNKITFNPDTENRQHVFDLDTKAKPRAMDLTAGDGPAKGKKLPCAIYEVDGDSLSICMDKEGQAGKRPSEFKTSAGDGFALLRFKRVVEPEKPKPADDARLIQGTWRVIELHQVGVEPGEAEREALTKGAFKIQITADRLIYLADNSEAKYRLDASKTPRVLELLSDDKVLARAIYELKGDDLKLCQGRKPEPGEEAMPPSHFDIKKAPKGTFPTLMVMKREPEKKDPAKQAQDQLQGTWLFAEAHAKGRKLTDNETRFLTSTKWTFKGQSIIEESNTNTSTREFRVDPSKKPAWLDFVSPRLEMVYGLEGNTLTVAIDDGSQKAPRPSDLKTTADSNIVLLVFKRADPDKEKPVRPEKPGRVPDPLPTVKDVQDDLVHISAGSKSSLKVGDTLEVYRTEPKPAYVGEIRLLAVEEYRAVGKLITKTNQRVKVGDLVGAKVLDK